MPRKTKRNPTTAELLVRAENDLREAQARVDYYKSRLEPLQQQMFAELAALGAPLERPDDFLDLGLINPESPLFEPEKGQQRKLA